MSIFLIKDKSHRKLNELQNMRARIKIAGEMRVQAKNAYFRNDLVSILDRLDDATARILTCKSA